MKWKYPATQDSFWNVF